MEWEKKQQQPQDALAFLSRIAEGLAAGGMRLDVSLSPVESERSHEEGSVLDVEAEAEAGEGEDCTPLTHDKGNPP
jgi:hypothetical protein